MVLDKAFEFAVILAWKDLMVGDKLLSARVQYESKPGMPLSYLSVWSLRSWGYQDRVCDYWIGASSAHPTGASFSNGHRSDILVQTLDFIMKNQDQFTSPVDAWRTHTVLISPPADDQLAEAAAWMDTIQSAVPSGVDGAGARMSASAPASASAAGDS
jgi:hypothetical protein